MQSVACEESGVLSGECSVYVKWGPWSEMSKVSSAGWKV